MDITSVFGTAVLGSSPGRCTDKSGYGLVVEYVLAKDETRVRFSLPAQINNGFISILCYFWIYFIFIKI